MFYIENIGIVSDYHLLPSNFHLQSQWKIQKKINRQFNKQKECKMNEMSDLSHNIKEESLVLNKLILVPY